MYIEVIIPRPLAQCYTYSVIDSVQVGMRVIVPFGRNKLLTALVYGLDVNKPAGYKTREVHSVVDEFPIVSRMQLDFWEWIAEYYLCTLGEVMQAALPSGFLVDSETVIHFNSDFGESYHHLEDDEYLIAEALHFQDTLKISDAQAIIGKKNVYPVIRSLLMEGVIFLKEELKKGYTPKYRHFVSDGPRLLDPSTKREVFEKLEKAPSQLELLLTYQQLKGGKQEPVLKSRLVRDFNNAYSLLKNLETKEILISHKEKVSRVFFEAPQQHELPKLSAPQAEIYREIGEGGRKFRVNLIHGVTGSGKTMIYAHLIRDCIMRGKQAIFLLPEIALTGQMVQRLRRLFGARVAVYHSRFSSAERIETWYAVNKGEVQIILGARSALFLPFLNPELIIVDEEHDQSYKQHDPAPRYQGRDLAIYLGSSLDIPVVLGSGTPSLESILNAESGKYHLFRLTERFGGGYMPAIGMLDLRKDLKLKRTGQSISDPLYETIKLTLSKKEQVILFIHRRGYAPMWVCTTCGYIPECHRCDVTMTYHQFFKALICHYCGSRDEIPSRCPACGTTEHQLIGSGTEKLEEEVKILFPEISVDRLDYDTTRSRKNLDQILEDFENGATRILLGTQMVSKGLDFDNVGLVGIVDADAVLFHPHFRSSETAYQLFTQVAGRAGRSKQGAEVIIQTRRPEHPVIQYFMEQDIEAFWAGEKKHRMDFRYPPYTRLAIIHLKHKKADLVKKAANLCHRQLQDFFGKDILAPVEPLIGRVNNYYLREIYIRLPKAGNSLENAKNRISEVIKAVPEGKGLSSLRIYADVDP